MSSQDQKLDLFISGVSKLCKATSEKAQAISRVSSLEATVETQKSVIASHTADVKNRPTSENSSSGLLPLESSTSLAPTPRPGLLRRYATEF